MAKIVIQINHQNLYFGQNNKRKIKGLMFMIKDFAWNVFKKTGDINMYLEFRRIEKLENKIKGSSNETNQS